MDWDLGLEGLLKRIANDVQRRGDLARERAVRVVGHILAAQADGLSTLDSSERYSRQDGTCVVPEANRRGTVAEGEAIYAAQCAACHATGAAGAPKIGDAAAWGPRVAQGFDVLLTSALKGKGAMSPQGGGDFSDFEIARAVVHLANQGGAKFEEPKAPAAAASAAQ